jgi:23S rRNA U2552 (ribose-2'-O)-methylase RlmE/FtsJ
MIYFTLPNTFLYTYKYIGFYEDPNCNSLSISNSLSFYLNNIKEKIDHFEKEWDIYKKYTNPYEYIHTPIPNVKKSVCKYKPLSRSYFKMIELIHLFNLKNNNKYISYDNLPTTKEESISSPINNNNYTKYKKKQNCPIKTFHLAEGPGGFIEAFVQLRNNPLDVYIGMTILDNKYDMNIPSWKKSTNFLKENVNVFIENGIDQTGDILNIDNFVYCKNKYGSSIQLITADGGFDFSMDFNNQEIAISKLLFAQMAFALCMQSHGGDFILKIFDSFMPQTIDILYILSSFYETVYITKPQTSRFANSEKYIVCKNFCFNSNELFFPYLYNAFSKMLKCPNDFKFRFLNIPLSNFFLSKLEEFNSIIGQQQIENIHQTISLIEYNEYDKNDQILNLIKNNVQKSINWCLKYNIPFNNIYL